MSDEIRGLGDGFKKITSALGIEECLSCKKRKVFFNSILKISSNNIRTITKREFLSLNNLTNEALELLYRDIFNIDKVDVSIKEIKLSITTAYNLQNDIEKIDILRDKGSEANALILSRFAKKYNGPKPVGCLCKEVHLEKYLIEFWSWYDSLENNNI